ncbi:MAG: SemiSWEET transporter [Oligoflexia bacterium]|nr:SemiSWEET transporter [Oligoflexia bacterium]
MVQPSHFVSAIGLLAGLLTTISFVPQVLRIWRTRSARDVSGLMFVIFSCGVFFWLMYGVLLNAWPIIITNGLTLTLSVLVLVLKAKYSIRDRRAKANASILERIDDSA